MTHGHTRIPSRGFCIYCGVRGVRLTDEHVVPLSLGGFHILEGASCHSCADITKRFEQDLARELWGDARVAYDAPSRRKRSRPKEILLHDPVDPRKTRKIAYADYPAAMVFYTMEPAGMLRGIPETIDSSDMWKFVAISDQARLDEFEHKFGFKFTAKFRHVPQSFARVIAKIGYCNTLTMLGPEEFNPICLPYIVGRRPNLSFIVGSEVTCPPPDPGLGYVLKTMFLKGVGRALVLAEVRLYANNSTPRYHVVVGEIVGDEKFFAVVARLGHSSIQIVGLDANGGIRFPGGSSSRQV